ncbi:MAG: DUF1501 domain-containing protein [Bacteroidota bacterium]|nr:DUF1501 domain-containing protein [Candidatus Kapabacteria bacterium]MDW8272418.1 DUF1501 domain-containing protein [Bacteroidota bacterium]
MKRRDFLKTTTPLITLPLVIGGLPIHAIGRTRVLDTLWRVLSTTDRVLVLIQLNGGNDGINTVIPLDQLSAYYRVREHVALPESSLLPITNSAALHPAMTEIQRMYNEGMVTIIQGVAYPNTNLSHFRSTDIWMTASDYNEYLKTGWMGRYLNTLFPNYPSGYPNASTPDPPAIQIGAIMALALHGSHASMGLALQDPETFYNIVNGVEGTAGGQTPDTRPGRELAYLRQVELQSQQYSACIKAAADRAQNRASYPSNNTLADQLRIVARLIAGGLQTRVYLVSINGFDTHAAQVEEGNTTQGIHATLLGRLSSAVYAFFDDLRQHGLQDRVIAMTFSEFGRRVASNASYGTDHGTAAPMFVFGTQVIPGIRGTNPSLTELDANGNLLMQYDFRQVYTSILAQWFGVDRDLLRTVMLRDFPTIPIIQTGTTSATETTLVGGTNLEIFPNPTPCGQRAKITFRLTGPAEVEITLHDETGRSFSRMSLGYLDAGHQECFLPPVELPGVVFCTVRAGNQFFRGQLVVE